MVLTRKFIAGLLPAVLVAFVVTVALPLAAQAQGPIPPNQITTPANCKFVGPAYPLELNTISSPQTAAKTIKAQKEIFYCYATAKDVPDDKTLADPMTNRDKLTKGLTHIVEMEIFAIIEERLPPITTSSTTTFTPGLIYKEIIGDGVGDDDGVCERDPVEDCIVQEKSFQAVRIVKQLVSGPPGTTLRTWAVASVETWMPGSVPEIPSTAARQCTTFGKSPYTGGPIPVEDPTEMNTVLVEADGATYVKTIKVNKEVFRCFSSGSPNAPVIYDIEFYTEELESFSTSTGFDVIGKVYEVAYCAKKEKEAILMGCSWRNFATMPFAPTTGGLMPAALRPFVTLQSAGVRNSAGQLTFEAQGYNIEGVQVQVYNMAGKMVFKQETSGTRLSWNGLASDGRRLANGVYLYVMTVQGTYGDVVQTKVQKFAILR